MPGAAPLYFVGMSGVRLCAGKSPATGCESIGAYPRSGPVTSSLKLHFYSTFHAS